MKNDLKNLREVLKSDADKPTLKAQLSHLANSYVYNYQPSRSTLTKHCILKKLRNDKEIVILRLDKESDVVVLSRSDYEKSIKNLTNDKTKDTTPYFLKSFLVYKFVCARCKSCYIGETCRHIITRIDEHAKKDKKSHVFQHVHSKEECFSSFDLSCFSILDSATTKYHMKLKEGMCIDWEKPNLNKQKYHLSTTLSI